MNSKMMKFVAACGAILIFAAFAISQMTDDKKEKAETTAAGPDWTKVGEGFRKDLEAKNFNVDKDIRIGSMVDWSKNPVDHRGGAFGDRVETCKDLTRFLDRSSEKSKAVREFLLDGVPKSERKRVLDGDNFVPVQFLVDIDYSGNSVYANGDLTRGGDLTAKAGDVFCVFVGQDNKRYWKLAVRTDCVNPGLRDIPEPRDDDDDDDDSDDESDSPRCPSGKVPYLGRCVKPGNETDRDGAGGDESWSKDSVSNHRQPKTKDAPDEEPPPAHRDDSDDDDGDSDGSVDNGSSGNDGAEADGESDEESSDESTDKEDTPDAPMS